MESERPFWQAAAGIWIVLFDNSATDKLCIQNGRVRQNAPAPETNRLVAPPSRQVNLPNAISSSVEKSKIVDHLLAFEHPEGSSKAEFFTRFGFTAEAWRTLASALTAHAGSHAVSTSESEYGLKYRIDGPLRCPDGRTPLIRAVWIIDIGADTPRLVTAHPL